MQRKQGCPWREITRKAEAELQKQTRIANFMPILGCEMYVARRGDKSLRSGKIDHSGWHLIVLAKNEKGYHNLIKLVSRSWVDGFYMRPRTDPSDLKKYHEGLIVSSACLGGEVAQKIMKSTPEEVDKTILWYKEVFGDDYYLSLCDMKSKTPPSVPTETPIPCRKRSTKNSRNSLRNTISN